MKRMGKNQKLKNVLENCDGFCEIPEEFVENYKTVYHWTIKDDKVVFPYIHLVKSKDNGHVEKTTLLVPNKNYIEVQKNGED